MTTPSNAAKAAALLYHTSGVPDSKTAVLIYDELRECAEWEDMRRVLDKYDAPVYSALEGMSISEWWDNLHCLALSIDSCSEELK
jgi:hypothetical protein